MSSTALIKDVTEATFADAVLAASSTRPVVVDFWAPWCGPCHQLSPLIERVAARYAGEVDVTKLNVDEAPGIASQFQIQGIPAVKGFRDGRVVAEFTGVQPESAIEQFFAQLAPSEADRLVRAAEATAAGEREVLLRQALEHDPGHPGAVVGLAGLLAEQDRTQEAIALLKRIPGDPEAERLLASLTLAGDRLPDADLELLRAEARGGDPSAALALGRALAAGGAHAEALEALLAAVSGPSVREEARESILAVFQILGDDHELVRIYRPKLATALF